MQKKSFLIKDILQKLNEDADEKKVPFIDAAGCQLPYDWRSLAMVAAVSQQNNALIGGSSIGSSGSSSSSTKTGFNWSKFTLPILPDGGYLLGEQQSKLRAYFPFAAADALQQSAAAASAAAAAAFESYQKRQRNYDDDDELVVDMSENSNLSLCESSSSSKFSDCESKDAKSETSSLISIENITAEDGNSKKDGQKGEEAAKKRRKNRRNRTVFTELQLMGLERRFDSQKYLSTPDRAELANALGLSQLQVKTWYQVMQGGCLVAPTKPKGRPKKGTIPSLGLTFDTSTLLLTIEARKNAASLLGKQQQQQQQQQQPSPKPGQRNDQNASLCSVSQLMAQHGAGEFCFSKANAFGTKRAKLSF